MSETLKMEAVIAVDGESPGVKISGVAYSGGVVSQTWDDRPIVVDLSGMEFAPQIPLMNSHCNRPDFKLGEVVPEVADNKLLIEGMITSGSEEAKEIVEDGKKSQWQLSIGAEILSQTEIKAGDTVSINGRDYTGPMIHVVKSKLREVSVVAIGADSETHMKIEAKLNLSMIQNNKGGIAKMEEKETKVVEAETVTAVIPPVDVKAEAELAVKAERTRIAEIQAVCNGEFQQIERDAISAGWTADETRKKVLEQIRAARPSTPNVIVKNDTFDEKAIECALAFRAGVTENILSKHYDEKTIDAGMREMDISLKEVVRETLRLSGLPAPRCIDNAAIQAAFSTVSLPSILGNVANKVLLKSYEATPVIAFNFCSVGNLTDFKDADRVRLSDIGRLQKVGADGEIKDGKLAEESATNKLETYGEKFCLTRQMIINDDLSAFTAIPKIMGVKAAQLIDQLFFERLTGNPVQKDGNALFSSAHGNLLDGADSVLSKDALQAAIELFMDQTDAGGNPINVEPRKLLVPTGFKFAAMELLNGALITSNANGTLKAGYNALADENISVFSSAYLKDKNAWYLFGDPNQTDTFEIGFLNGKRTPTIERGDTDFNTLGMWFRVYHDLGVRELGFRGMVKSDGQ